LQHPAQAKDANPNKPPTKFDIMSQITGTLKQFAQFKNLQD
jgi:hypothetical protein